MLISNKGVRLFAKNMRQDPVFCLMKYGQFEDREISDCFRKINIYPGETRDEMSRERFIMDPIDRLTRFIY